MPRDACYVALLDRLKSALPTVDWVRPPANWTQMGDSPMGCMSVTQLTPDGGPEGYQGWSLEAQVEISFRPQPGTCPDVTLNGYVDTVRAALDTQPTEKTETPYTSLGGAVHAAWISGAVRFGDGDQVSGVLIPITMLVAD